MWEEIVNVLTHAHPTHPTQTEHTHTRARTRTRLLPVSPADVVGSCGSILYVRLGWPAPLLEYHVYEARFVLRRLCCSDGDKQPVRTERGRTTEREKRGKGGKGRE